MTRVRWGALRGTSPDLFGLTMQYVYIGRENWPNSIAVLGVGFTKGVPVEVDDSNEKLMFRLAKSALFEEVKPVKRKRGRPRKKPELKVVKDGNVDSSGDA